MFLTDYGEEIINRLHEESALRDTSNHARKIIDYGVGGWLDNFDNPDFLEMFFLDTASDGYLDCWGKDFNVPRKIDETDDDYRQRIILESLGHLNIPYLREVYNLTLYAYIADYDPADNVLTSDNPYLSNRYMTVASEEIQGILSKKFVLGTDLIFLEI